MNTCMKLGEHMLSFLLGTDLRVEFLGHVLTILNLLSGSDSFKTSQLVLGPRTNGINRAVKRGIHPNNFGETFTESSISTEDLCRRGRWLRS